MDREDAGGVRPGSLAEASEVLRSAAKDGSSVLLRGGGTKLDWGGRVRADVTVDSRGLDRLVAHNPHDMTAEVGAGMPLARLQEALAEAGQWLAVDPPGTPAAGAVASDGAARDGGPTVGGVMASGDAGPRRLRYGTLRDLVIGVSVVLADGRLAQSGAHVIKNVAGYDLTKLLCGSLGTLGFVAQVIVRLHPRPPASQAVRLTADATHASRTTLALTASPLEPAAVEWSSADGTLLVLLEGSEEGVAARVPRVREVAAGAGLTGDAAGEPLDQAAARAAWQQLAADVSGKGPAAAGSVASGSAEPGPSEPGSSDGVTVARASTLPDKLPAVAEALTRAAGDAGTQPTLTSSAALGLHTCVLRGGTAAAHAATVRAWREAVERLGGTVTLRRRAEGVDELLDPWGTPPSAVELMRRVKQQLDPDDRCGPGRFAPWW